MTLILGFSAIGAVVTLARGYPKIGPGYVTGQGLAERGRRLYPTVDRNLAWRGGQRSFFTGGGSNVIRPSYGYNWME